MSESGGTEGFSTVCLEPGEASIQIISSSSKPGANETPADIRQYFQSSDPGAAPTVTFFDTLTPMTTEENTATNTSISNPTPPAHATTAPLCELFSEEVGGGDMEGKAFFDTIAKAKLHLPAGVEPLPAGPVHPSPPPEDLPADCSNLWIPSSKTQESLDRIAAAPGFVPDRNSLTLAKLKFSGQLKHPIAQAMQQNGLDGPLRARKFLTADMVSQDPAGIKQLISAGSYISAVDLIGRLLTLQGQGISADHPIRHTPYTLQLWYTRLSLLVKLQQTELAESEAEPFGDLDQPDLYHQFYGEEPAGPMATFAFRLLLAELPHHGSRHQLAMNRLCFLLDNIHLIKDHILSTMPNQNQAAAVTALWHRRECQVLYSLLNCALALKDFWMCFSLLDKLKAQDPQHLRQLESATGRIYLQLGDVVKAKDYFKLAEAVSADAHLLAQVEILINSALLAVAKDSYSKAYELFKEAHDLQPENKMLVNNMAVCLLYIGRLGESLALLESGGHCGHEGLVFNMCTLFELQSSRSQQRKLSLLAALQDVALLDSFNTACLKLPIAAAGE